MRKQLLGGLLVLLLISVSIISACNSTTQTATSILTSTGSQNSSTTQLTSLTSTAVSTTAQANWWDKFGAPQYGGTITFAGGFMGLNLDVKQMVGAENDLWYESLFEPSWTLDRNTWSMTGMYYPDQYWTGNLAESWTIDSPTQITVKLRQGVYWQNKAPVNGREFIASDVQSHYDRLLGTGDGYTQPAPMFAGMTSTWNRVTASDKYTVVFKFKQPSAQNFQNIADRFALNEIEAPEWVALGGPPMNEVPAPGGGGPPAGGSPASPPVVSGPLGDWKQVVGTGPWMLTDFISGSSFTFSKNPDYWGHDPRYPQNQVPYADTLINVIIPDSATRLAALRSGQIATVNSGVMGVAWQDATQLFKTNPDMQQVQVASGADGLGLLVNAEPFNDIRVRKALDMAIDRHAIAKNFYGGIARPEPVGMITPDYTGSAYAYADWPQSLKDEYAYNPTAAKKLLADAGYPNGFDTNAVTTNDAVILQLMQVFKSYFADIGVNMEIRPMDRPTKQAFTRAGKHDQMSNQVLGSTAPPAKIVDSFYSKGADAIYFGLNKTPDAAYDTLRDEFVATYDPTKAMKIFQKMDKDIIEQHIVIAAPQSYYYMAWQPWLKGYSGEATMWGQGITWSRLWTTKK